MHVRRVWFSDVFAQDAEKLAEERGIGVMESGWVDLSAFLRKLVVDWNTSTLRLTLYTGETKAFGLEPERHRPSDATEAALFDQLRERPSDGETRAVYADWLE